MQDAMLKNDIISALEWEPDIDLGAAGISVIEGLVTLFGRVSTVPQRDALERAVLRVRGVAMVTNEIEVASRADRLPAPAEHRAQGNTGEISWHRIQASAERVDVVREAMNVIGRA